jgi:hypothetical protein
MTRTLIRPLDRPLRRGLRRKLDRFSARVLPGGRRPRLNYLPQALSAFAKVMRCDRRLMKLAPLVFDAGLIRQRMKEREEQRKYMAEWEEELARVYGRPPNAPSENENRCKNGAKTVQSLSDEAQWHLERTPKSEITRRKVDAELAKRRLWMNVGSEAFENFHKYQRNTLATLSQVCALIEIAVGFGRFAAGMDTNAPSTPTVQPTNDDWEENLRRAYGKPP